MNFKRQDLLLFITIFTITGPSDSKIQELIPLSSNRVTNTGASCGSCDETTLLDIALNHTAEGIHCNKLESLTNGTRHEKEEIIFKDTTKRQSTFVYDLGKDTFNAILLEIFANSRPNRYFIECKLNSERKAIICSKKLKQKIRHMTIMQELCYVLYLNQEWVAKIQSWSPTSLKVVFNIGYKLHQRLQKIYLPEPPIINLIKY